MMRYPARSHAWRVQARSHAWRMKRSLMHGAYKRALMHGAYKRALMRSVRGVFRRTLLCPCMASATSCTFLRARRCACSGPEPPHPGAVEPLNARMLTTTTTPLPHPGA
eukprot:168257-Chlamydomonas_euryale.AAC.1